MVDPGCEFPSLTISQPRPVSQPSQPPEDQHRQDCRHRHVPGHHKNHDRDHEETPQVLAVRHEPMKGLPGI